jgi:hypothetical protein
VAVRSATASAAEQVLKFMVIPSRLILRRG